MNLYNSSPVTECDTQASQLRECDCITGWAEFNKQHSDEAVYTLKSCEDWVEGGGYGILCGSIGRVRARKDVTVDVLGNQFLKMSFWQRTCCFHLKNPQLVHYMCVLLTGVNGNPWGLKLTGVKLELNLLNRWSVATQFSPLYLFSNIFLWYWTGILCSFSTAACL